MAATERALPRFKELGVEVIAANTEADAETSATASEHGLSFPVAAGLAPEAADALGAWTGVRQGDTHIQPCEFVIRPDGTVAASLYATTQLGRMDPDEVLRFIQSRM